MPAPIKGAGSWITANYLKNPEYFLPSLLGPVWFDLISLMFPSLISTGLTYFFIYGLPVYCALERAEKITSQHSGNKSYLAAQLTGGCCRVAIKRGQTDHSDAFGPTGKPRPPGDG